jgi:hypothetical protein
VIYGEAEGGGRATLTYRLTPRDGATHFERELVYRMPNLGWRFWTASSSAGA